MGFGFNLLMVFVIFPLSFILLLIGMFSQKQVFFKVLFYIWVPILCLIILELLISLIPENVLEKKDYYGGYVIDRKFFPGKQADWQYNHFRIKITQQDSVFLYITENEKVVNIHKGTISTVMPYNSERLVLKMEEPTHHIIKTNPTTYRERWWKFYLVFESAKFHNMYFRKGKWKKIDQ